jgi:poly(3-hydroxybutyrate) depolymerase
MFFRLALPSGATVLALLMSLSVLVSFTVAANQAGKWPGTVKGEYDFDQWPGGELQVHYSVPPAANAQTPILVVIPGARRNADTYRDHWHQLAMQHEFIVLSIRCGFSSCPTEYEYNLGGAFSALGEKVAPELQFFSAPELVFRDFTERFGSAQQQFALYGHSAGGGFVHLYMLMRPDAPVSRAVSANGAFFTKANLQQDYPFGLKGTGISKQDVNRWLTKPLTIMLGAEDTGPRTKALSNSEAARRQGLSVFARGLAFYARAMNWVSAYQVDTAWQLHIVQNIGHNSRQMTPHALPLLFPQQKEK